MKTILTLVLVTTGFFAQAQKEIEVSDFVIHGDTATAKEKVFVLNHMENVIFPEFIKRVEIINCDLVEGYMRTIDTGWFNAAGKIVLMTFINNAIFSKQQYADNSPSFPRRVKVGKDKMIQDLNVKVDSLEKTIEKLKEQVTELKFMEKGFMMRDPSLTPIPLSPPFNSIKRPEMIPLKDKPAL